MILIKLLIILSIITFLINLLNVTAKVKIFINIIVSSIIIFYLGDSVDLLIIITLSYMCFLYIST